MSENDTFKQQAQLRANRLFSGPDAGNPALYDVPELWLDAAEWGYVSRDAEVEAHIRKVRLEIGKRTILEMRVAKLSAQLAKARASLKDIADQRKREDYDTRTDMDYYGMDVVLGIADAALARTPAQALRLAEAKERVIAEARTNSVRSCRCGLCRALAELDSAIQEGGS